MAQVDFTNAVIEPYDSGIWDISSLRFNNSGFYDSSGNLINSNSNYSQRLVSATKTTYTYTGVMSASGTEFYISYSGYYKFWKVSNISFSNGDSYSFVIDVDISIV